MLQAIGDENECYVGQLVKKFIPKYVYQYLATVQALASWVQTAVCIDGLGM